MTGTDPFTGHPAETMEQHYAALSDQHLKNLVDGTIEDLVKNGRPETAAVIQELLNRAKLRAK